MKARERTNGVEDQLLSEQLAYQKRLNRITADIHSAADTDEILLNLQKEILGLLDADRITVYTTDPTGRQIVSRFKTGDEVREIRVPIGEESIAGYCALCQKVVNVLNVYNETEVKRISPRLNFDKRWDQRTGYRTTQVLAAPIRHKDELLGVVQIMNKRGGGRFTEEDELSVVEIAEVLGSAFFKNRQVALGSSPTKFDHLIRSNIISRKELVHAMSLARNRERPVESVLMEDFHVTRTDIGKSLSTYYQAPFIPLGPETSVDEDLLRGLRESYLRTNGFIPVERSGDKVVVAMEDPGSLAARDAVRKSIAARRFEYGVSLSGDIRALLDRRFSPREAARMAGAGSIEDIIGQLQAQPDEGDDELERISEEDGAVVQLVTRMITDAHKRGASDIHIEPGQGKADAGIRLRIDGQCIPYQSVPYTYKRALASRLKIMSDLDIAERRLPQDGKIRFGRFSPLDIELRVVTVPTAGGNEDVVLRLLPSGKPIPLEEVGLVPRDYSTLMELIRKPYGMILVVGPTGSGKTTTLHAALHAINQPQTKIWTAEDPVEITQPGLRQAQVKPRIGFDFSRAMKAFLRADPDVIMVGEMRDRETAGIAIEASLTGHLVFSTLHTNSAPETVTRLLDMGMDPYNFADSLLGVLAQRLVRVLCPACKEPYRPSRSEFESLKRAYGGDLEANGCGYSEEFRLFRRKGCSTCSQTGYRGRTGIHELLVGTDAMRSLIQGRARTDELRAQAQKDGMSTLMQNGIRKVCLGATDMAEVRRVSLR